MIQTVKTKEN